MVHASGKAMVRIFAGSSLGILSDSIERSRVKRTVKREADRLIDSDHSTIELRLQVNYKNEFYRMPVKPSLYKVGEGAD